MIRLLASALALGLLLGVTSARAEAPRVVVSLAPLHSLVAGVLVGVATPDLLIKAGASPHNASLRPSDARALAAADLVIWVGPELEATLAKPIAARAGKARVLGLADHEGITLLEARDGGVWDHDEDHDEEHEAHEEDEAHDHGRHDPHLWLDPQNGRAIVAATVEALSEIDPVNAALYRANGARVTARIDALDGALARQLAPLGDRPYVVFHDAYQYFERRYGLHPVGALSVSPDRPPGAKRLAEIRDRIRRLQVACLFTEPQYPPALVAALVRDTNAKSGSLDPMGAALTPGPDAYFLLMQGLADGLTDCLLLES